MSTMQQPFDPSSFISAAVAHQCDPTTFYNVDPTTIAVTDSTSYYLDTFHQFPHGDFRPTFYNPFEIKHRRRTSRAQLKVLEKSFAENSKPNATIRRILAQKLDMTPRGVQIWFQNRRAKAKLQRRKAAAVAVASSEQQQQQQLSSNSNDHDHEKQQQQQHYKDTADMEQSVLFSQFFAHVHPSPSSSNENPPTAAGAATSSIGAGKPAFTSYLPPSNNTNHGVSGLTKAHHHHHSNNATQAWGYLPWQQQQHQHGDTGDNVRSVAEVAAAVAAAASYEQNTMVHMSVPDQTGTSANTTTDWLSVPHPFAFAQQEQQEQEHQQHQDESTLTRRKSCPVMPSGSTTTNTFFDQSSMEFYQCKERRVSENDMCSYSMAVAAAAANAWSNSSSYNSPVHSTADLVPTMDFYGFPDNTVTALEYAPGATVSQFTPTLTSTASSSVSNSVAGSPISTLNGCHETNNTNNNSACFECIPTTTVPSSSASSSFAVVAGAATHLI